MNVVNIAGYYTFNHNRFSFPAALYQNYYQRHSAGSLLAGFSFQGGSIKTTDELKARSQRAPEVHLTFTNVVYHFTPRYFAGASMMMSNSIFDNDKVTVNQNKWLARAFLGIRL